MLSLGSLMIGSHQPQVLAEFYTKVFERPADMVDGAWHGWKIGTSFFSLGEHSEIKGEAKEPQRLIINFETQDVKAEFDRMKGIGAKVITEPYDMQGGFIATLADPDGNYFQLMSPWE